MRVFIKKQSAIQLDDEPIKLLKAIEETKARIQELENGEKATEERYQHLQGELNWLRTQLSSGELVLKDAPKINQAEADANLHQKSLKRIASDLKKNRQSLERLIENFNRQWLSIDVDEPIR